MVRLGDLPFWADVALGALGELRRSTPRSTWPRLGDALVKARALVMSLLSVNFSHLNVVLADGPELWLFSTQGSRRLVIAVSDAAVPVVKQYEYGKLTASVQPRNPEDLRAAAKWLTGEF